MPLDKVVISHLEEQDVLEERIEAEIDSLIMGVDVKALMDNPEEVLMAIVNEVQSRLENSYYHTSAENGIRFAEKIVADGDIKITDSNDPNLNEGVVGDVSGEDAR